MPQKLLAHSDRPSCQNLSQLHCRLPTSLLQVHEILKSCDSTLGKGVEEKVLLIKGHLLIGIGLRSLPTPFPFFCRPRCFYLRTGGNLRLAAVFIAFTIFSILLSYLPRRSPRIYVSRLILTSSYISIFIYVRVFTLHLRYLRLFLQFH
ncbi:hypothetical protein SKAU_G00275600 [Synaphobranchus kaupii]|uniref:Uncharacterized protein n=1 Tax=Synaphobranchus kaupii TaxID=118154 RepID=A0A9Q1F1G4_SYNKA|nr:hypothetical protein SKAU_G00275600 [Synaphobranchus kaupii]